MEPRRWCRISELADDGNRQELGGLEGEGPPDLAVVDELARLALAAVRRGHRLRLSHVAAELAQLLELAGLRIEVEGEAERGEETLGGHQGEEVAQLGDPSP